MEPQPMRLAGHLGHDFRREPGIEVPVRMLLAWADEIDPGPEAGPHHVVACHLRNLAGGSHLVGWEFHCTRCKSTDPHTREPCAEAPSDA